MTALVAAAIAAPTFGATGHWQLTLPPSPGSGEVKAFAFNADSCVTASFCIAVGYRNPSPEMRSLPLVERWAKSTHGTRWRVQRTPEPAGAIDDVLYGVACVSTHSCMAVGAATSTRTHASTDRWNGRHWTLASVPVPTAVVTSELLGVSCPNSKYCVAVGYAVRRPGGHSVFTVVWNGKHWAVKKIANPGAPSLLSAVSCPTVKRCEAVGEKSGKSAIAEKWNGSTWKQQKIATVGGFGGTTALYGVSCVTTRRCIAVGAATSSSTVQPVAQEFNGTHWRGMTVPSGPSGAADGLLDSVSCTTATACVAAGEYGPGAPASLAESWHGHAWSVEDLPALNLAADTDLLGVSCVSKALTCWAAGLYTKMGVGADVAALLAHRQKS